MLMIIGMNSVVAGSAQELQLFLVMLWFDSQWPLNPVTNMYNLVWQIKSCTIFLYILQDSLFPLSFCPQGGKFGKDITASYQIQV